MARSPIHVPPTIILPNLAPLGTEVETLNDLLEHTSNEFDVSLIQEKNIEVVATEVITAGVIGNLNLWVELSPYPSTITTAYWAAIGGGGGAIAPVAPVIIVPTGVTGTVHTLFLPWTVASSYARLVTQMPAGAAPATAYWTIQAIFEGKTP